MNLICPICGKKYDESLLKFRCECGSYLNLDFRPVVDPSQFEDVNSLWRYRSVLPIDDEQKVISLGEGCTPLVPLRLDGVRFWGKLEFMSPSGSFKDRGATVMVSKLKGLCVDHIVEDSSGNSACAISAYCAKGRIHADIYVPSTSSRNKFSQIQVYGSTLYVVDGDRQACADAALNMSERYVYASHSWNPYFMQGTKTMAYEVLEQLNWNVPDYLFIPVGSGSLLLGTYLALQEMKASGIINRFPALIAVQSEKFAPVRLAIDEKWIAPKSEPTVAEGIAIRNPVRLHEIVAAIKATEGTVVTVSDQEVIEAAREIAREGIFVEPTSASVVAALKQYKSNIRSTDLVVVPFTGSGLKSSPFFNSLFEN